MVYQHLNHTNYSMVIKTFFYLQTMLMGFLDKHIFLGVHFWYIILAAKTMTTLWIYIEIKSLDESSIKLGNKSLGITQRNG
jgi:ABC-type iron transport system FetAB permease component